MNGKTAQRKLKPRDLAVRIALVALYVAVLALVYARGRTHTLLIDNAEVDSGRIAAFEDVMVSVNGAEPVEYFAGDRDMAVLKGQSHLITLEPAEGGQKIEKRIKLPIDADMLIVSLPKLAAGEEPAVEVFVPLDFAPPEDESADAASADSLGTYQSPEATPEVLFEADPAPAP